MASPDLIYLATLACAVLASCAWPTHADVAPPLAPAQAVRAVVMQNAQGPEAARRKEQVIEAVQAEGRAELMQLHLGVMAAQGDVRLYRGNTARLLIDGPQTLEAMKTAIGRARHRILAQFYIVDGKGVAAEMAEHLLAKAAQGVRVAMLYDSVGSLETSDAFFERLRAGGVQVCAYNPVNPTKRPGAWGVFERNHRKMLAVDSDVGFTGGLNLSQAYAEGSFGSARPARAATDSSAEEDRGWRDTQVQVSGPVVRAMAQLFHQTWAEQQCKGALPPDPPPRQSEPGERVIRLVAGDPDQGVNPTYTTLLAATAAARRSVYLTMAYFAPGDDMVDALANAARRGVDVRLVLPGRSDVKLVQQAARSYYARLLEAGVRIHEVTHAVMHAKTFVVDGVLSSVGSSNLDWRSIAGNDEMDLMVLGDDFGTEMQALFEQDVSDARRIDAAQWQERGLLQRAHELVGRLLLPLL